MSSLYNGGRRTVLTLSKRALHKSSIRSASRISIPVPPAFPVLETTPSPTCACRESPPGLDIDREANLNGTMAAYAEQVLISTGRSDWKSNIEEDEGSVLVKQLRKFIGRGGKYTNVSIP